MASLAYLALYRKIRDGDRKPYTLAAIRQTLPENERDHLLALLGEIKNYKRIKIIGEIHPDNVINDLFEYVFRQHKEPLKKYVIEPLKKDPELMFQGAFWLSLKPILEKANNERLASLRMPDVIRKTLKPITPRLDKDISTVIMVLTSQEALIKSSSLLILEGDKARLLNIWLDKHNKKRINLEEGSIPYSQSEKPGEDDDKHNRLREDQWLKMILFCSKDFDANTVLIVGAEHAQNKYGLIDKLRAHGIEADITYTT